MLKPQDIMIGDYLLADGKVMPIKYQPESF